MKSNWYGNALKRIISIALAVFILTLSGCVVGEPSNDDGNKKTVAASFYPVYIFTINLLDGIDSLSVECMAQQNVGCLHDYTLTAKDVKLLNDADVLVINGAGMESFIEDSYKNAENLKIIDSSENVELICNESHHHHEHNGHSHHHEHNSHIWLSVDNVKIQVENIKNGLVNAFPEHSEKIEDNYRGYILRLNELLKQRDAFREQIEGEAIVSFHNAYEYFAMETGFSIFATIESEEGGEPSAKVLAHLSEEIKKEKIKALFVEPFYEGSAAEILSRETGAGVYTLNPVTSGEVSLTAYEDIMLKNYETILRAVK